jgi:gliding motility-associated-like protein
MTRFLLTLAVWCSLAFYASGQAVIGPKFTTPCSGQTFPVPITNGVNGDVVPTDIRYSWPAPTLPTGLTGAVSGTTQTSVSATLTNSTSISLQAVYIVTPVNTSNEPIGNPFSVTFNVLPYATTADIKITPASPKVCSGLPTTLGVALSASSTITPGTEQFVWYSDAGLNSNLTSDQTSTVSYTTGILTNNTTYYITARGANKCANTPATAFSITVNVDGIAPDVSQPSSQIVCAGGVTNLVSFTSSANIYNAGVVYNWTNSTTSIGLAAAGSGTILPFSAVNNSFSTLSTTITVTPFTTTSNYTCSGAPKTFTIQIVPVPFVANQSLVVCSGSTLSYVPNGVPEGTTYTWVPTAVPVGISGATTVPTPTNQFNPTLVNSTLSPLNVEFTVTPRTSSVLCAGPTFKITVTVRPRPVVTDKVAVSCSGRAFEVSPTGVPESTFYTWAVPEVITGNVSGINSEASQQFSVSQVVTNNGITPATVRYIAVPRTADCTGNPFSVTVTINPKPVLDNSGLKTSCNNTLFSFTPTSNVSGTSFNWFRALVANITNAASSGSASIGETLVNVSNSAETVIYAFTLTANGCSYNQDLQVQVRPVLGLASDLTRNTCSQSSFYYIGLSSASGTILSWTRTATAGISNPTAGGLNIPVSEVLVNTTNAPINVTYQFLNRLGECSNQTNVVVTVNPLPVVSTITDKVYCSNENVLIALSGSAVAGTNYNWESTNINIGLPNAGSGDISFVATNATFVPIRSVVNVVPVANGCSGLLRAFTITVNPTPILNTDQILSPNCSGTVQRFTPTSPIANTSYSWTRAVITGINNNTAGSGTGNVNEVLTNNSNVPLIVTYNYLLTANGCSSQIIPVYATVNPTPGMFNPGDQTACNNALKIINFTGSVVSGTEYLWTNSNTSIGAPAQGNGDMYFIATNATPNPLSATITVYPRANGCSGTLVTFRQVVNTSLVLSSSLTPAPVCSNTNFQYTPNSPLPNVLFSWNRNVTPGISNLPTSGSGSINESLINTTSNPVTVTYEYSLISTEGCTSFQNVRVVINPSLVISNAAGSYEVCSGSAFNFVPTANITGIPYIWTRAAVNGINNGQPGNGTGDINEVMTNSTDAPIEAEYIYKIGQTITCASDQTVKVTIKPLPRLTGNKAFAVCSNAPVSYTPIGSLPGTNFNWARNAVQGIANPSAVGVVGIPEALFNTTSSNIDVIYKYDMTNYNGCVNSEDIVVTVKPVPVVKLSTDRSLCHNDPVTPITFESNLAGTTFKWENSQIGIGLPATGTGGGTPAFTATNNSSGQLVGQIRVIPNLNGCDGLTTLIANIIVNRAISGSFIESAPAISCPGVPVGPLVGSVPLGGDGSTYNFQWDSSRNGTNWSSMGINFITRQIMAPPQTTDSMWYRMRTISLGCSTVTNSVKVILRPKPVVKTSSNDSNTPGLNTLTSITISKGNSTQVFATGAVSYLWTPNIDISNIRSASPLLTPKQNTKYKVVGTSIDGCIDSAFADVKVEKLFLIYPNNILTPNGDGYNDTWKIRNIEWYPDNTVTIYNNNGIIIRTFEPYSGDWNGTRESGLKLTSGTYYYVIKLKDGSNEAIIKGYLTLLN